MAIHIFITWLVISAFYGGLQASNPREKRDASGALHIVNNHAQPIHADVKSDGRNSGNDITDKPCPKDKNIPSHVESGVVFQVTPPEDAYYVAKSLRKSLEHPSKLEVARSITRLLTLAVLLVSAAIEFYPMLVNVYKTVYSFLYS